MLVRQRFHAFVVYGRLVREESYAELQHDFGASRADCGAVVAKHSELRRAVSGVHLAPSLLDHRPLRLLKASSEDFMRINWVADTLLSYYKSLSTQRSRRLRFSTSGHRVQLTLICTGQSASS